ncbi:hypothetical protein GE21DRAFT_4472 [Neurospora crassa]|uniref:Uncharacterized protein n=1 Tax=Neurospora crassa (strain ATCC 24698 / 74-OR23-1A / CBS 708.71 / DSM 1257 / FGSC 987) TaxID=367110 RepID=Q7RXB1_NEUCR|nr:hypothetical protein NCU00176 [Neurospora crassa OR74A]EAA27163.2 hypothetical protein NCU00176 [Neurospora crassa OR74A]KHE89415.1 hypothetical protein GE21DRAFT_4472 [Neurospora crassa]|eukprot:XP_956399.2 hypothetical protein NCU00176 [Neurospora crassa OR74A]
MLEANATLVDWQVMQAAQALYEVTVKLADELPYTPTSLSSPVFVALCPVQEVSAMLHRDLAETFGMKSSKSVTLTATEDASDQILLSPTSELDPRRVPSIVNHEHPSEEVLHQFALHQPHGKYGFKHSATLLEPESPDPKVSRCSGSATRKKLGSELVCSTMSDSTYAVCKVGILQK